MMHEDEDEDQDEDRRRCLFQSISLIIILFIVLPNVFFLYGLIVFCNLVYIYINIKTKHKPHQPQQPHTL